MYCLLTPFQAFLPISLLPLSMFHPRSSRLVYSSRDATITLSSNLVIIIAAQVMLYALSFDKKDSPLFFMATKPLFSEIFRSQHCNSLSTSKDKLGHVNGRRVVILG